MYASSTRHLIPTVHSKSATNRNVTFLECILCELEEMYYKYMVLSSIYWAWKYKPTMFAQSLMSNLQCWIPHVNSQFLIPCRATHGVQFQPSSPYCQIPSVQSLFFIPLYPIPTMHFKWFQFQWFHTVQFVLPNPYCSIPTFRCLH